MSQPAPIKNDRPKSGKTKTTKRGKPSKELTDLTLLPRHISSWRAPAIPKLPELPGVPKKTINDAKVVLMTVLEHCGTFQVTKKRIVAESGLSSTRVTRATNYLKELNMFSYVAVRDEEKLRGCCAVVDLDGKLDLAGGFVTLWSVPGNDAKGGRARKRMRRQKTGVARSASFSHDENQEALKQGGPATFPPAPPYNDEPVRMENSNPPTPLAGGDSNEISGETVKNHWLPDHPDTVLKAPDFEERAPARALSTHLGESNLATRLHKAIEEIDTKRMNDREIAHWWHNNIPGRMLDDCLAPGEEHTPALMRRHMRRLKRSPGYIDCIVWHWAVTRRSVNHMPADVLCRRIRKLYDTSGRSSPDDGVMNYFAMVHSYRYQRAVNGAVWNARAPRSYSEFPEFGALDDLPSDGTMTAELEDMTAILLETEATLQSRAMDRAVLTRYFRLRAWLVCRLGGCAAAAFEAMARRFRLTPDTNSMLSHWCVTTEAGRRCYQSYSRFRHMVSDWPMTEPQLRLIFGFTTSEWELGISDHAARCLLLDGAFNSLQWDQKGVCDYGVF